MDSKRREFLETAAVLGTAAAVGTAISSVQANAQPTPPGKQATVPTAGKVDIHKLPELPYAYNALEPYIDAKTVEIHHDKHHAAYVANLNKAEDELAKARGKNDYSLIDYWTKKVSFNGAGNFLHTLYWDTMSPKSNMKPTDDLEKKLTEDFGSFEKFKEQFTSSAKTVEGSGWALLTINVDGNMQVLQAEIHQNLTTWNVIPILVCDVWEHAYYLKYQNKRPDYIAAWWNVVNWEAVSKRYAMFKMK